MTVDALLVLLLVSNIVALWLAARWRKRARRTPLEQQTLTWTPVPGLGRCGVSDLEPGDEVFIWAHDHWSPLVPEPDGELWKHGTVAEVSARALTWRSVTITFEDGRTVYTMPEAKVHRVARAGLLRTPLRAVPS